MDTTIAIGFAQEIPGGFVFEIGNGEIQRRIHCISGRIGTTSLINGISGEEYLDETTSEFEITISGEGQKVALNFKDFQLKNYETPNWDDNIRTLALNLEMELNGMPLPVSVFYEARAGESFMRKWLEIGPCDLQGWTIRSVILESIKLKEMVEGVTPQTRYSQLHPNYEDNVHIEPDKVTIEERDRRFQFGDTARAIVTYWGYGEGLFFFTQSLFGEESFYRPKGLFMKQRAFAPLSEGLTTGPAIIGTFSGPPEIGFKRCNDYLMQHWCAIDDKKIPVAWNTWLVTLEGDKPLLSSYDRNILLDYIERMREAGFYETLQIDLGWESGAPLKPSPTRFPNGLNEIAHKASEAGLGMAYWINPFSQSYWRSEVEDKHPEWVVPNKTSPRSGAAAMCVMSNYYKEIEQRITELPNARLIYWDGNDWNTPDCTAHNHDHLDQEELEVKSRKRLAELCGAAREANPDVIITIFSLPFDNHRLCAVDQEQVSDTHSFPIIQSELIQRQQIYSMTWEHPYKTIRGSWYGVGWHEAGKDNLTQRPLRELFHAEMSMIGNGIAQAGGSIDLKQAPPAFVNFLKKLFAFRKRFENYFDTYQHVLGFPDGKSVDGEGHIVDGSGFIVLVNPTGSEQSVILPLSEPELELPADKRHKLSDWSTLERGFPMDPAAIDNPPEITLAPLEVKYIGVNVKEQ